MVLLVNNILHCDVTMWVSNTID